MCEGGQPVYETQRATSSTGVGGSLEPGSSGCDKTGELWQLGLAGGQRGASPSGPNKQAWLGWRGVCELPEARFRIFQGGVPCRLSDASGSFIHNPVLGLHLPARGGSPRRPSQSLTVARRPILCLRAAGGWLLPRPWHTRYFARSPVPQLSGSSRAGEGWGPGGAEEEIGRAHV